MTQSSNIVLYSSYQVGDSLPGYIQFALKHLAETKFKIVLLTNKRELNKKTLEFLKDNDIYLYLTENHGFDFGMWRRFLKDLAQGKGNFVTLNGINRLVLMNDSIVYYLNRFKEFFERSEQSLADVISLTKSEEYAPHPQSFFLYIKQEALGAFYMHLLENPEYENYYDIVHKLEIGMGSIFEEAEVKTEALFKTGPLPILSYIDLINNGVGFVKKRLLERRFGFKEKLFYVRRESTHILNEDYRKLILNKGLAPDFKEEWLPNFTQSHIRRTADILWEKPVEKFLSPIYNKIHPLKNSK